MLNIVVFIHLFYNDVNFCKDGQMFSYISIRCSLKYSQIICKVLNADCPKILNTDPMSNMKYAGL